MSSRSEDTGIQTQHSEQKNLTGLLNLISIAGLVVCAILAVWAYKSGILKSVDTLQAFIRKFGMS